MKVAISTDRDYVSAHFGRCPAYTIVEVQEGKVLSKEEIPNPGHQPGFLPEYLSKMGVNCIIAGGMGPRAQTLFAQKNIETVIGVQGPVEEAIEKFINQELEAGQDLCNHRHGHPSFDHHTENISRPTGNKICITSKGEALESEIDPNFGRARYFLIVNPESLDAEAVENPNSEAAQGAGIQSAQLISSKMVRTVLTGNCGPNAQRILEASGIRVVTGISGKVKDALSRYTSEVK